ncbi:MAG: hypothetical protein ABI612_25070, partial [Betaproteobacteria bacterium]
GDHPISLKPAQFYVITHSVAAENCKTIDATMQLHMAPEGCASPVNICTKGTLVSGDPSLSGATWLYTSLGTAPSVGLSDSIEPATTLSYAGAVLVTTLRDGTLTTRNAGVFDTVTGSFSQLDKMTGGTGRFAGAKGYVFVTATGSIAAGFRTSVRGEICSNP